jgi:hypothetical protein
MHREGAVGAASERLKGEQNMNDTTYTLLIWEEIPETTHFVLIPNTDLDAEDLSVLRQAHGCFIDGLTETETQRKALDYLNAALAMNPECLPESHPEGSKWAMRWTKYVRDAHDSPIEEKIITHVFLSGFVL